MTITFTLSVSSETETPVVLGSKRQLGVAR